MRAIIAGAIACIPFAVLGCGGATASRRVAVEPEEPAPRGGESSGEPYPGEAAPAARPTGISAVTAETPEEAADVRRLEALISEPRLGGLSVTIADELKDFLRQCDRTCSARVRAFAFMYLGCALGASHSDFDADEVRDAFRQALSLYPRVELDESTATEPTRGIWQSVRGATGPTR